jgi:hypothetical protein
MFHSSHTAGSRKRWTLAVGVSGPTIELPKLARALDRLSCRLTRRAACLCASARCTSSCPMYSRTCARVHAPRGECCAFELLECCQGGSAHEERQFMPNNPHEAWQQLVCKHELA